MAADIKAIAMPKWGMEMSEGVVAEWHVAEGDNIKAGDDIVDIETSKIVNTVTAHTGGILRRKVAQPGATLPVGALLGVLAAADVSDAAIDQFIQSLAGSDAVMEDAVKAEPAAPAPATAKPSTPPALKAESAQAPATPAPTTSVPANQAAMAKLAEGGDDSAVAATPIARRLAKEHAINLNNITGTGRHDRVTLEDLEQAVTAAGGKWNIPAGSAPSLARTERDDSDVHATPVARRLARELDINLLDCRVSGTRQRVSKADVEALAAQRQKATAPGARAASAEPLSTEPLPPTFEEAPLSGMRRTIAARLQESKQTAPHFRVQVDARLDALLAVRKQLNDSNPNAKISVNDFIVKACASALMKVPGVNVQFDGTTVRRFADADIAVAVALDEGLITPIVRGTNRKGLIAISNELRDLSTRAKLGTLKPGEFQGGTFTVSNLGMLGVKQFDAIINPPQCAILAVGAGEQRPVVINGQIEIATVVSLSLSSDHRIIDGALAARFMAALQGYLEQPATMLG